MRLDAVEFACLDRRSDRSPVLGSAVGAGEEFSAMRQMARLTTWESISIVPLSMNCVRPCQRESA